MHEDETLFLPLSPVTVPHFSLPFRFVNQGAGYPTVAVSEQDSSDEIKSCVEAILRYEIGSRPEKPDFGITDPTFSSPQINTGQMYAQVDRSEPRVALSINSDINELDNLIYEVRVNIETNTRGGTGA